MEVYGNRRNGGRCLLFFSDLFFLQRPLPFLIFQKRRSGRKNPDYKKKPLSLHTFYFLYLPIIHPLSPPRQRHDHPLRQAQRTAHRGISKPLFLYYPLTFFPPKKQSGAQDPGPQDNHFIPLYLHTLFPVFPSYPLTNFP